MVEAVAGASILRAPELPPSDTCENCGGTGKLGDGTVSVECPVCDGTGKPATINLSPETSGMKAPAVKHDAASSGGGTYKSRRFRRR